MNSEGRHDRSASDVPQGQAADGVDDRQDTWKSQRPAAILADPPAISDERHTDDHSAGKRTTPRPLRDPIDAVKAALDGTPPPKPPPPIPPRRPPPGGGGPGAGGASRRPSATWTSRSTGSGCGARSTSAVAALILLPIVTFGMAYMIVDVPKPGDIRTNQVSTILASDGSEIAKIVPPEGNRVDVNIDQIPVHVRDAVMAAEDRDFYSNPGFSFTGFARAFKNNIFGGDLQGGSTITQQYVKNALVGDARSGVGGLVRKAKELVISTKMSSEWSKDQVLQSYLNIIYFGRGAYGIARGVEGLLRQAGRAADGRRGCAAGGAHPAAVDTGSGGRPGGRRGAVELGARRHGRRSARCRRPTVRRRCFRRRCRPTRHRTRTRPPARTG